MTGWSSWGGDLPRPPGRREPGSVNRAPGRIPRPPPEGPPPENPPPPPNEHEEPEASDGPELLPYAGPLEPPFGGTPRQAPHHQGRHVRHDKEQHRPDRRMNPDFEKARSEAACEVARSYTAVRVSRSAVVGGSGSLRTRTGAWRSRWPPWVTRGTAGLVMTPGHDLICHRENSSGRGGAAQKLPDAPPPVKPPPPPNELVPPELPDDELEALTTPPEYRDGETA